MSGCFARAHGHWASDVVMGVHFVLESAFRGSFKSRFLFSLALLSDASSMHMRGRSPIRPSSLRRSLPQPPHVCSTPCTFLAMISACVPSYPLDSFLPLAIAVSYLPPDMPGTPSLPPFLIPFCSFFPPLLLTRHLPHRFIPSSWHGRSSIAPPFLIACYFFFPPFLLTRHLPHRSLPSSWHATLILFSFFLTWPLLHRSLPSSWCATLILSFCFLTWPLPPFLLVCYPYTPSLPPAIAASFLLPFFLLKCHPLTPSFLTSQLSHRSLPSSWQHPASSRYAPTRPFPYSLRFCVALSVSGYLPVLSCLLTAVGKTKAAALR